jgi:site-specific DNA recombinase
VIRNGASKGKRADRIPAHEIEDLVARRLQSFLGSGEAVLDGIAFSSDDTTFTRALVAAAKLRSTSFTESAPAEAREFLLEAVSRVVVNEKSVEILIRKQGLRAALFGDTATPMALPSSDPRRAPRAEGDVLRLTIEARVKRCGGEVRMVVPAGTIVHEPVRPVPSLIKAVARAHDWYSRMITGETRYQSVIAEETGFDERYVSRIMKCAFLAPDIVEAILAGRQPPDLTLEKVLYRLPSDWTEQRQLFGFPALPSR